MKKTVNQKWRHVEKAAVQIIALKTKYPEIAKKIPGILSASQCGALLKAHKKVEAQEDKFLEQIDKLWVRFAQKSEDKAKKMLSSARILKARLREVAPNVYKDIFGGK